MGDAQEIGELEEPSFERPSFADLDGSAEEDSSDPERPFNPSYNELDGKEKTMGAVMMAEMTLDMYEKGCFYLGKIPEISEAKIDKLIARIKSSKRPLLLGGYGVRVANCVQQFQKIV
jgi:hypothetical protein